MTRVLIVDDSATDRCLVGGLFGKGTDFEVDYAGDGAEALRRLEQTAADVVVTDLIMPEMDGLQLVAAMREKHPLVPVILMTSKGSEEVAVQALQEGASSYVNKDVLATDLVEIVERVLAVSHQRRSHMRLLGCITQTTCTLTLQNDRTLITPLVSYLQDEVAQMGLCDQWACTRVGIALEEALQNAVYHGNLEIDSQLREENEQTYYALVERRLAEPPFAGRRIHVEAALSRAEAKFVVRDEGSGFDPSVLPDPTDPANLERLTGRGVLLMRTFMDEVSYNDVGNAVTLVKRRDSERAPPGNGDA